MLKAYQGHRDGENKPIGVTCIDSHWSHDFRNHGFFTERFFCTRCLLQVDGTGKILLDDDGKPM